MSFISSEVYITDFVSKFSIHDGMSPLNFIKVFEPSIEYLNDSLSDTNTKQVYFDTNDNIENALRVYISVFVENLNERNEINKMDVDSSGGKRTRKHKALYYKKFTRNMKHKKNKLTRKKKYNKKRKNTKRN